MPQAAIAAGATLGGALLSHRGQSNALREQRRTNDQAMRLERDRMTGANARYERDYSAWQDRQRERNDILRAVLGRYGVSFGAPASPGSGPAPGSAAPEGLFGQMGRFGAGQAAARSGTPVSAAPIEAPMAPMAPGGFSQMPGYRPARAGLRLIDLARR